jgi:hypothetical protein
MPTDHKSSRAMTSAEGTMVDVPVSGTPAQDDYAELVEYIEGLIDKYDRIRLLIRLTDFHGCEVSAFNEGIKKFDWKHYNDVERLAIVGESKWRRGMTVFCKPLTTAEVRYFEHSERADAREWIEADLSRP